MYVNFDRIQHVIWKSAIQLVGVRIQGTVITGRLVIITQQSRPSISRDRGTRQWRGSYITDNNIAEQLIRGSL